jgi:hypothetical protein
VCRPTAGAGGRGAPAGWPEGLVEDEVSVAAPEGGLVGLSPGHDRVSGRRPGAEEGAGAVGLLVG